MLINTDTIKLAVIGDPIGHSLSPFMHNSVFEEHGMNGIYLPFRVKNSETAKFAEMAAYLGFSGFNATMPHKINLMSIVDDIDDNAKKLGAINTVQIRNGRLKGYNTDAEGLFKALRHRRAELNGARVLVLGAGGAAGAIVRGLGSQGVSSVSVVNRTVAKAEELCSGLDYAGALAWTPENLHESALYSDVIINCTSLGMKGTGSDFEDDELKFLDGSSAFVADLIYSPWKTGLLSYAEELGLTVMNGLDMLIYQGLLAFEIMTGTELDTEQEFRKLYSGCKAQLNVG